jgi:HEAT repeat protein
MSDRCTTMEACAAAGLAGDPAALPMLLAALADADWHVRYAAAVALGDLRDARALNGLLALLEAEDAAPLYTQPEDYGGLHAGSPEATVSRLPAETPPATAEAWRRRGRVKQAACFAIAAIAAGTPAIRACLERYTADEGEDYMVRAAAARALGVIGTAKSCPALEAAAQFHEFCTKTEAAKALARLCAQE